MSKIQKIKDEFGALFIVAIILVFTGFMSYKIYSEDKYNKLQAIALLNKEQCKLEEIIQPQFFLGETQYKYKCNEKSYTLNTDYSSRLNN